MIAYERCLRNVRLTEGSPTVLDTAKGLAGSLRRAGGRAGRPAQAEGALGRWEEARKSCIEAYALLREVLGRSHPSTLTCAGNLAVTLKEVGRIKEAESRHKDAPAALIQRVGNNHPLPRPLAAFTPGAGPRRVASELS